MAEKLKIIKKERQNHPGMYKLVLTDAPNAEKKFIEYKDGKIKIRPEAYSELTKKELAFYAHELKKLGRQQNI